MISQILFITGTDTAVGKTVLTTLLLSHLRAHGCHALAMKPFCSGSLRDVHALSRAQNREISERQITPFYFTEPLAPLVAGRNTGRTVALSEVVEKVLSLSQRCQVLLVEGAGGLLVPLGRKYTVADLIATLRCPTVVVARNKLGAVNHTLLTLQALRALNLPAIHVVLMGMRRPDSAAESNPRLIRQFVPEGLSSLPFVGSHPTAKGAPQEIAKKCKKILAQIARMVIFSTAFEDGLASQGKTY